MFLISDELDTYFSTTDYFINDYYKYYINSKDILKYLLNIDYHYLIVYGKNNEIKYERNMKNNNIVYIKYYNDNINNLIEGLMKNKYVITTIKTIRNNELYFKRNEVMIFNKSDQKIINHFNYILKLSKPKYLNHYIYRPV